MIPYDDLERALARWKARRSGAVEAPEVALEGDETPAGPGMRGGAGFRNRDHTSELELSDAEVDEA